MATDELLLHRYAKAGDPAAFRELVDRYADLVFGIGLRVTGDRQMAEDVCQECFLELARKARTVRENVAGWLHAVATSRSLNVVRSRKRRARREQAVAGDAVTVGESPESRELQLLIDRALNGLSDDLRLPIIFHYLQGQSQQQVAQRLGINQATVSRRLQRGVEQLRRRLGRFGIMTTVATLTSFFGQSSAQAASASLADTLTKIGLGGVGVTVAKSASGGVPPLLLALGAVAGNVAAFLLLEGWVLLLIALVEISLLMRPPAWVRELIRAQAFGRDVAAHPMWPYRRWTWTIPPTDWQQRLVTCVLMGFIFGLVAFGGLIEASTMPGFVALLGLMAALLFMLAARIAWRVWIHRENLGRSTAAGSMELYRVPLRENAVGWVLCTVVGVIWLLSMPRETRFTLSAFTISALALFVISAGTFLVALIYRRPSNRGDAAVDDAVSAVDNENPKPVARRYHVGLTGFYLFVVVVFLFCVISDLPAMPRQPAWRELDVYQYTQDGAYIRTELPKLVNPPSAAKGRLQGMVGRASMGFLFAVLLLQRVVKTRDQFPRSARLGLLAFSVLAVFTSAGLMARCAWVARVVSEDRAIASTDFRRQLRPTFQPSPRKRELVQKYAAEAAVITVPDEQLPDGWYLLHYENSFDYPVPREGPHRDLAIEIGLPDVPELDSVVAHLVRIYFNSFVSEAVNYPCVVHAFCCDSEDHARRLNHAWGHLGLCKDRLVIFVYSYGVLRAPSSTDQAPIPTLFEHIRKAAVPFDAP